MAGGDARRRPWLLACVGFLMLSLLGKAWGIVMPAVLLLLDVWPLRRWPRGGTWDPRGAAGRGGHTG